MLYLFRNHLLMLLQVNSYDWGYATGVVLVVFLLFMLPVIFFLITQQNTLKQIQPQNRAMSPGEVWLQLIPLFGLVWQFFVVSRISESIRRELASASVFSFDLSSATEAFPEEKPTYSIGMAYCILICCGIIPLLGALATLGGIVCWIIYWVKLSEYKNKLQDLRYNQSSAH